MSILIVEDDRILRRLMSALLQSEGYDILEAADGVDAIQAAKRYPGLIDLLVTDIHMPNMNGHDLSHWFRNKQPDIPIVVMSSEKKQDFPPHTVPLFSRAPQTGEPQIAHRHSGQVTGGVLDCKGAAPFLPCRGLMNAARRRRFT